MRPNASKKIGSFLRRLGVFLHILAIFSCVLFGGKEKFRISANGYYFSKRGSTFETAKAATLFPHLQLRLCVGYGLIKNKERKN